MNETERGVAEEARGMEVTVERQEEIENIEAKSPCEDGTPL